MRKTIPKPESQTDGCGQALGSLEGQMSAASASLSMSAVVATDSLSIAKSSSCGPCQHIPRCT